MQVIKCRCCYKLLAKIGQFDQVEIKCPRCKSFNVYMSTVSALSECREHQNQGHSYERKSTTSPV